MLRDSFFSFFFQELEKLSQKFSENVLDATKKFEKLITDKKEIEGLPATALGLAAEAAVSKVYLSLVEMHVALVPHQPLLFFVSGSL